MTDREPMEYRNYFHFQHQLDHMQRYQDEMTGRVHNMDNFGHWVRVLSRRLTYVFYRIGLKGPNILFSHFIVDLIALFLVWRGAPLGAMAAWLISYVLDNCDGDLARARGEANSGWGRVDSLLHTWGNAIYWPLLGALTGAWPVVAVVLALRVVMEHHRGQYQKTGDRYGERSRLWSWIVLPTDVTIMYLIYVPFALAGRLEWYLYGYLVYYLIAALGQGAALIRKVAAE